MLPGTPWTPRAAHACASHRVMKNLTSGESSNVEYLFLIGGWDGSALNDVWQMNIEGMISWLKFKILKPCISSFRAME